MTFATTSETQKHNTHLQVITESYKSEPKTVSIRESITPLYGKGKKFQIRDTHFILLGDISRVLFETLFFAFFKKKRRQGECRTFSSSVIPSPSYTFIISGAAAQCNQKWTVYKVAQCRTILIFMEYIKYITN